MKTCRFPSVSYYSICSVNFLCAAFFPSLVLFRPFDFFLAPFQFYDLLNIFKLNGLPSPENPYLFNGDFVDRGSFSVECIFVLFGFKLLYPDRFFMSRGNHESENMNKARSYSVLS